MRGQLAVSISTPDGAAPGQGHSVQSVAAERGLQRRVVGWQSLLKAPGSWRVITVALLLALIPIKFGMLVPMLTGFVFALSCVICGQVPSSTPPPAANL